MNDEDRSTVRIRYEHHDGGALVVSVKDGPEAYIDPEEVPDEPLRLPTWKELRDAEAVAAVRALSPAIVEELRQMWRADARDEAKLVLRDWTRGRYIRIP